MNEYPFSLIFIWGTEEEKASFRKEMEIGKIRLEV